MGRTKHIAPTPRPESSPLLEFEALEPGQNNEDAVVYCEESGILTYDGKTYKLDRALPEGYEVTGAFLIPNFRGEEIIFIDLESEDDCREQIKCKLTVLPSDDEQLKLTTLYKDLGTELAKEAEKVEESLTRMKTLIGGFHDDVAVVCPGFNFKRDIGVYVPIAGTYDFIKMDEGLSYMKGSVAKISDVAEPFSKKRKSCD